MDQLFLNETKSGKISIYFTDEKAKMRAIKGQMKRVAVSTGPFCVSK